MICILTVNGRQERDGRYWVDPDRTLGEVVLDLARENDLRSFCVWVNGAKMETDEKNKTFGELEVKTLELASSPWIKLESGIKIPNPCGTRPEEKEEDEGGLDYLTPSS